CCASADYSDRGCNKVYEPPQQQQQQQQAPIPTVIIDDAKEDADMTIPIRSHPKRMKSVGPIGAKQRKLEMLTLAQKELPHQEELPEMKSTSPEVSKSASLSFQHDEEEREQQQKTIQERSAKISSVLPTTEVNQPPILPKEPAINMDKGKAPVEVNPSCPTVVPETAAKTSSTTPLPPTDVRLSCSILDSINQSVEERIAAAYAMVDDGLYPRDPTILLGTEPRRLRGAMMVNVAKGGFNISASEPFMPASRKFSREGERIEDGGGEIKRIGEKEG
ncbi:hypothetical protein Dimus_029237, partial [Dionaea muscipula]